VCIFAHVFACMHVCVCVYACTDCMYDLVVNANEFSSYALNFLLRAVCIMSNMANTHITP
jgi:hypothetical protein